MVLPTAAVGVNNRGNRPRLGLRFAKESAGESNASMPSVPGPLHAIGRVSAFSLSVRHRTPFPRARDSHRPPSAANHPAKHHQRIIGDRPASDRTDFELPRRSVQADVRRQPASTARTALRDASIVRHNRLRRQNVDRLFARRAGNAVSRMTHGSTTLVWLLVTDAPRPESPGASSDCRALCGALHESARRPWFSRRSSQWTSACQSRTRAKLPRTRSSVRNRRAHLH